ncbi:Serine/threonine-protein kinase PEPKR2 [Capsicum baccatum]|uniref:Serine/threonine-protein kinase PEPKR2 n=2 Tax=Capsicum TaxID=4071 RepID=A0A2G2Y344_CAPAN|nr:serine/threonine-protein kinase PEPKR2 isoform X2 [Capsicum annuum]XP_016539290.2 serine/threonine-protein kinase PEPKR2 isoform X2 [Capsicum annuum]XP_047250900.1 serine/threonine-protein kinase PEPKR2 isoform X2 [Capsicum annuum]PHT30003.1 Serine/threonine-protein kinase PEPKR2 [Capsicum baccatum]KAF3653086.1 Serine/threonine-protein kinase PEPKR2 [Capsicum annuum]KAF3667894.1 Serine/threonine-protein kinase PEPKR2 [Capsicum annuum]PHT64119.1 Serine/threonine-protein kinase PEPKR2 [Capsi
MENLGKKRKGVEISVVCQKDESSLTVVRSHLSLEDYSRRKKKSREIVVEDDANFCRKSVITGVATAPSCGSARSCSPGRGLKRKIGCLDSATRLGRKKKIEQDYEMGEVIGRGKFGSVLLCQRKLSGESHACKTLHKGEEIIHREVEIMQHLSGHPGVVTLKAVYEDAESFYLVMELCSGGRLLDQMARIGRYPEQQAANVIKDLMLVIRYCHEMGVVHRDIKPENVLLTTSGQVKVSDFGLAVRISYGQSLTGVVGSPAYVAPEVLLGDYTEKVDIWSAGVLLHALLVGLLPFQGDSLESLFSAIKEDNLDFSGGAWESVSQPARDLLSCMMTRDVSARYSADEVLRHPWILHYTEPALENHAKPIKRQLTATIRIEHERRNLTFSSLSDDFGSTVTSGNRSSKMPEGEDTGFIDALTVAVSHMNISEPKRSRICSPARAIDQECSSNIQANHLCTAF